MIHPELWAGRRLTSHSTRGEAEGFFISFATTHNKRKLAYETTMEQGRKQQKRFWNVLQTHFLFLFRKVEKILLKTFRKTIVLCCVWKTSFNGFLSEVFFFIKKVLKGWKNIFRKKFRNRRIVLYVMYPLLRMSKICRRCLFHFNRSWFVNCRMRMKNWRY